MDRWEKKKKARAASAASSALVEELAAAKAEVGSPEAAPKYRGLSAAADGAGGADVGSVRPLDADVASMAFLAEYLETRGGSASMVDGWYSKTFTRPGMPGKASTYNVYYHPNGEAFSSHKEVARHLGLISERPKESRRRSRSRSSSPPASTAPPPLPPSAVKSAAAGGAAAESSSDEDEVPLNVKVAAHQAAAKRKRAEPAPAPAPAPAPPKPKPKPAAKPKRKRARGTLPRLR